MLNPSLYKAFCIVFCILPVKTAFSALPVSSDWTENLTREQYIAKYKDIAVGQMHRYGIPASIILAQACLESGNGNSRLAKEGNNHFGIKCHNWEGDRIYHDDDSEQECFRKYRIPEESFYDHSEFLRSRPRYSDLFLLDRTDYRGWALGLKKAGYATNPQYAELLIDLIEKNNLHLYDTYPPVPAADHKTIPEGPVYVLPDTPGDAVFIISVERRVMQTNGKRYILSAPGDTYRSVAAEFGHFTGELTRFNDVPRDAELAVGEKVYLERKARKGPAGETSRTTVVPETLHDVSQRTGIRLESLRKLNPGMEDRLGAGTVVRLR